MRDSSIIFMGEDEPLMQEGWSSPKTPLTKIYQQRGKKRPQKSKPDWKTQKLSTTNFPATFVKYFFWEESVFMRLISSLCPPFGRFNRISVDIEGSFLSMFFLTLTLYWGFINNANNNRAEISRLYLLTLSILLTGGYITCSTILVCLLSSCSKTYITTRQIISILGYGLFGHAVTLLVSELISDDCFVPLMCFLGGLDSLRICFILMGRTPLPAFQFLLCTPITIIHLMYLAYLHFTIMRDV